MLLSVIITTLLSLCISPNIPLECHARPPRMLSAEGVDGKDMSQNHWFQVS